MKFLTLFESDEPYITALRARDWETAADLVSRSAEASGRIKVYHGSARGDFASFDLKKAGSAHFVAQFGDAVYTSTNPKTAKMYGGGKFLHTLWLANGPALEVKLSQVTNFRSDENMGLVKQARAQGMKMIRVDEIEGYQVIVLDPSIIALGNLALDSSGTPLMSEESISSAIEEGNIMLPAERFGL